MPMASYGVPNFLGGEISQFAQGRFDKPDYRTSLNVCLNAFPVEIGAWARRPGTMHGGATRGGAPGRTIKFDFEQANAVTLEFTDGMLRARSGAVLITSNDAQVVVAVSAANPAVVQTTTATTWATGNTLLFSSPSAPLLENRQFTATKIDATHFSLVDALTGATIDGSTLGALAAGAKVSRVQELATVYIGGLWSGMRAVQAETTDILLSASIAPQALTVTTLPAPGINPLFAINPAIFNDGPYLDPLTNGVQVTPSAKSGLVNLTLSFPAYSAAQGYGKGLFVTDVGVNYESLADQNVGNTPAASPLFWAPTSAGAAIGPNGFQGSDIGRLIRLFSEPPLWLIGSTYAVGAVVTYNPSGQPGASTYWQSQTAGNTGHPPGADLTNWSLIAQGAAIWTWGRIVSLSNLIDRALAGSSSIGDMTFGAGLNAAFNGAFSQGSASSADGAVFGGFLGAGVPVTLVSYVGKNYTASPQVIEQATVYPSSDNGFAIGSFVPRGGGFGVFSTSMQFLLRGSMTPPASATDGTVLAISPATTNTFSSVTLISTDQVTAWNYAWVEIIVTTSVTPAGATSYTLTSVIAQVSFFSPPGTGTGTGVNLEIIGPALLYTNSVLTWRLGAYSNTTGWPSCGTYYEGRLWLGGAIANRFDASVSNGILGATVNFAPTDQYGVVAASNAISETLNSDSVNPIFWMEPDLQGLILGTQAGEYLVQAPTSGPMSPTNIAARRVTKIGCANVEPRRTEHTTVFAQRYRKKLMEYFPDVYSGKFTAPNIADKAEHIAGRFIAELAYTSAVTPIIWGRCDDGSLFGVTYKRDTLTTSQGPTFNGWHRHALGSGRIVESICAGPSVGGDLDALTIVTNDPATGIRHVEVLTDTPDENTLLTAAWFLDDAVAPSSTVISNVAVAGAPYGGLTLHGLWHLNGKTATVFAGGLDCGDFAVANGSCFVPFGDSVSAGTGGGLFTAAFVASITPFPIVVGFTYNSDGQMVRPITAADTGARNGPALGKIRRNHRYSMLLSGTLGLSIGTNFAKLFPANFKQANGQDAIPALSMFNGVQQDSLADDYGYDGMMCWRVSRPYPANVIAIAGNIAAQDQ
jgi:hypothetical protein